MILKISSCSVVGINGYIVTTEVNSYIPKTGEDLYAREAPYASR